MFGSSFTLGKLFGVRIGINFSLLFIAGLITLSMAEGYYPNRLPNLSNQMALLLGVVTSISFFLSILWHEMAHALMARFYHIRVKEVVLNLIGGMTHMEEEPRKAGQFFWIAFIGPLSSAILAGLFWLGGNLAGDSNAVGIMLHWLAWVNIALAGFNMIPGFPLDGGRALLAVVWYVTGNYLRGAKIATTTGKLFAAGFVALATIQILLTQDFFGSLWTLFIAAFLWGAAREYMSYARTKSALADIPVTHAIESSVRLSPEWSILYALDEMSIGGRSGIAPVYKENELIGVFGIETAIRIPKLNWGSVRVGNVMRSIRELPAIAHDASVFQALAHMERNNLHYMLVQQDAQTIGIVGRRELVRMAEKSNRPRYAGA